VMPPWAWEVHDQEDASEEEVCYEFGAWVDACWRWLREVNPYGKNAAATD